MRILSRILLVQIFACATIMAQGSAIVPNENLIVEGVPTIPATLASTVGRYTEFRGASFSSWHPTKREMLIGTRFGDTVQVHQVKFPGGDRRQLTFFPDRVTGGNFPPRGGEFFVFTKDTAGAEFFQKYRYDLNNGNVTLLTDGKSRNTGGAWSNSGQWFAYGSTRRNGKDVDLYLVNPADPKSEKALLQLEGGGWDALDWSPDDRQLIVGESVSANESYLWLVNVATVEKTLLTPKGAGEKVAYGGAQFSKDGKGVYVTSDRDSEFQRLAYIDLATKQYKFLTDHIKWDVDEFDLSPDGKTLAFVTNEDGIARLHLLDTGSGKEKSVAKLPVGQIFGIDWHEDGTDLGFTLVSARSTADVYSLDVKTGKVDRWTYSETGGLNTDNFSEPELVRWKSFDDKMISGFLYLPSTKFKGPRPVVIDIHGGPEGQFRPGFLGRNNYFLEEMGVALSIRTSGVLPVMARLF